MKRADFEALQDEWNARLRASGFRDIESPSGDIEQRHLKASTRLKMDAGASEYMDAARAFLYTHTFRNEHDRRTWELHVEGETNRAIARTLKTEGIPGGYRKRVDLTIDRLRDAMLAQRAGKRRRGRPRDPGGLRAEGSVAHAMLFPIHVLALDHIRTQLQVSAAEAVRRALLMTARNIAKREKTGPRTGNGER